MQEVDRNDQLRERFSLSHRHGFKKYYVKITLGLIDMAAVNGWIRYKVVNVERIKGKCAWYNSFDSLTEDLVETDWQAYE